MKNFFDKILLRSNNLDYISHEIKNLSSNAPIKKIFDSINSYSKESELRYIGGCVRKIINKEKVDDIDLATNLEPDQVRDALNKNNIVYYETGLAHGTLTAKIEDYVFEITTLREDVFTDGRHAKVKFSTDWKKDASRRDFTINSIYSDKDGNLFDPYNGKNDLENGFIKFIGDVEKRINEDYLRILRYLRFFLNYSKHSHSSIVLSKIKKNISNISYLSKERIFDELKKTIKLSNLEKLAKDKSSLELFSLIFPELKNLNLFSNLNSYKKEILKNTDFIFLLSLMIVDEKDNIDYFLYKFNIRKKDQNRLKTIDNFSKEKFFFKTMSDNYLNNVFYFNGKQAVIDIINFKLIKSKKFDNILFKLRETYLNKKTPIMPISASLLMTKYGIPEGKNLGIKLKNIEKKWVDNNFKISDHQIENIINN
tara:strand:- start:1366 stop:2640 length:1275 start_codon:yes stop_codon:yes gene_type:complete